jgi:hypothetical protein
MLALPPATEAVQVASVYLASEKRGKDRVAQICGETHILYDPLVTSDRLLFG